MSSHRVGLDDRLVVNAELEGMRLLARMDRPKISVRHEDLPGASCHWTFGDQAEDLDLVRLRPDAQIPLRQTLQAIQASTLRSPGRGLQIRGTRASFASSIDLLTRLGAVENTELPRALMARDLTRDLELPGSTLDGYEVIVAADEPSLRSLQRLVAQTFAAAGQGHQVDPDADFYYAPDHMTYLAIQTDGVVTSTGSILIADKVANVWSVATSPDARGRGAGSAVMKAICHEAKRQGAAAAALRTTDDLARVGGLYSNVGFQSVGNERIWDLKNIDDVQL